MTRLVRHGRGAVEIAEHAIGVLIEQVANAAFLFRANDEPDVVLLPAAITQENVSYYANYWGWYYPSYGYGWYYPGYYPTYTSYTSGSLILQMTLPDETNLSNNTPVVWFAVVNSILEGSSLDIVTRLERNIDQAFTQSEYLKH